MITDLQYALMAGRAYQTNRRNVVNQFSAPTGWTEFFHAPSSPAFTPSSIGFEAVSFLRPAGMGTEEIVISYAGTDGFFSVDNFSNFGLATGFGSAQLNDAAAYYLKVRREHPDATITFTGHSLGGGLAALMGVFFGHQAVVFDQAPFAKSAELSDLHPDVASNLKNYLLALPEGYNEGDLTGLTNFIQERQATSRIPNTDLIQTFRVTGELLSSTAPFNTFSAIGTAIPSLTHGPADWFGVSVDLHSQSLLTSFIQNDQFRQVTHKLTDLLRMVFDSNLYANVTSGPNENFLERLVRHQNGNAPGVAQADTMLTRFTNDLWKLAQDGGLTMTEGPTPATNLVSKALIAFAMQKYYTETQASAGYNRELFTELGAGSSGGIRFDRADVATTFDNAMVKGYNDFLFYLINNFSLADRQRIEDRLPLLRDWYVQAGTGGMNATDTQNRGAFMLGGYRADTLTGGTGADLLVANAGHDSLTGGLGTDTLMGGEGFDRYYYNTGDGHDRIEDSDARGMINVNGQVLLGGVRKTGHTYWENADGSIRYEMSGTDLVVKLNNNVILTVNEDFQSGQFGIELRDASDPNWENGYPVLIDVEANGLVNDIVHYSDADSLGFGERGNDQLFGNGGNDRLTGFSGNDRLYGGEGDDYLDGDINDNLIVSPIPPQLNLGTDLYYGDDLVDGGAGNDTVFGSWGDDLLYGGTGNDVLYGDHFSPDQLSFTADDFLDGGEGDDYLQGDAGDDVLWGGDGKDYLWGDDQQVGVLQEGDDVLDGGAGIDQLVGGGGQDTLAGGAGDDLLVGDYANNPSLGFDDILDGGAGIDVLLGGGGSDLLTGGTENDQLFGEAGSDHLYGGMGDDQLQGGEGIDVLTGEGGLDLLAGQDGDDQLFGDNGDDFLDGGDGNDVLVGGAGNDTLLGGAGHDTYVFNLGDGVETIDDVLGANRLVFGAGISAGDVGIGQGSLLIRVGLNGDLIRIENFNPADPTQPTGIDQFEFANGTTLTQAQLLERGFDLVGTNNADVLDGTETFQKIYGLGGNDILTGGSLNNVIYGGTGNDRASGNAGDDQLFGEAGNDTLIGGTGDDILIGGIGADRLQGGAGQDRYLFNPGDGADLIVDTAGEGNRVVFGAGISAESVTLQLSGEGGLAIHTGQLGDQIQIIANLSAVDRSAVDLVEFADGSTLSIQQLLERGIAITGTPNGDVLTGTALVDRISGLGGDDIIAGRFGGDRIFGNEGNDQLIGEDGNDELNGGAGADTLDGGEGNDVLRGGNGIDALFGGPGDDTYELNLGDGLDRVLDLALPGEGNRILFGAGFTADAARLRMESGELYVGFTNTYDAISAGSRDEEDIFGAHAVESFAFSDGTVHSYVDLITMLAVHGVEVVGTPDDDFLMGTTIRDRFVGGTGNDELFGGIGDDEYLFNLGDGIDTIDDVAAPSEENAIVFGPGITLTDLRLDVASDSFTSVTSLLLHVGTDGDALQLTTFDPQNVFGPRTIESLRFADGSTLPHDQLLARGFDLMGTAGDDQLTGTNTVDRLTGDEGNDTLRGGAGDDSLDGGLGDDRLVGGQGNDTYLFGPGSGHDTIVESQGNLDTIRMAPGAAPSDVVVTRNNQDLVLSLNGGGDQLTVSLYFLAPSLQTERITFDDGTIWDQTFIDTLTQSIVTGTAGPDALVGTTGDDHLAGLSGDDQLTGLAGQDVLNGGTGADQLVGGLGDDTYLVDEAGDVVTELANEGTDTIQSTVSRSLEAYVENLTLTGAAAIHAIGNELDNILTGNSAANVLTGGLGNDTYVAGPEDTIVEGANEGIDTLLSATTAMLRANVENLTLTGNQPINGTGNAHDNILTSNQSVNLLAGGLGDDTYIIGSEDVVLEQLGEGTDTIQSESTTSLGANIENLTLVGDAAVNGIGNELANVLTGNAGSNQLEGREGADRLDGGAGADTLLGGSGQDVYVFQRGSGSDSIQDTVLGEMDTIELGPGIAPSDIMVAVNSSSELFLEIRGTSDRLTIRTYAPLNLDDQATKEVRFADGTVWDGATMASRIESPPGPNLGQFFQGTLGNDVFIGTDRNDFFEGLAGDDLLEGLGGNDLFKGYVGNDVILGGDGNDTLYGDWTWIGNPIDANDVLHGGAGNDFLYGEIGNDLLDGGPGNDWLEGGDGVDTYLFGRGYGTDQVITSGGVDRILLTAEMTPSDVVVSGSAGGLILRIVGTSDQLFAPLIPDDPFYRIGSVEFADGTIWSQTTLLDMARTIRGTDHADELFGTTQSNTFVGGLGDDTYVGVDATDTVVELPGEGTDTIKTSLNYTLPDHLENLTLQGTASEGTGNSADNVITGTGFDNTLDGGEGNDTLIGGSVEVDEGGFAYGEGNDVLIGGPGDDRLMPSSGFHEDGRNYLGQDVFGDDVLIGGPGNDTYVIYNAEMGSAGAALIARALVVESVDEGSDTVIAASDYTLGENVENLTLVGDDSLALRGTGNADGNVLRGNAGDNRLEGLGGNDTLAGSGGSDTLVGDEGFDTYLFNLGDGVDTIEDIATSGEGNRIQFGAGIAQSDLTFTREEIARTLTIQVGSNGADRLILTNFDPTNANGSLVVETLAFADGSTASLTSLLGGPVNHSPMVATPLADQIVPEGIPITLQIPANTFADPDTGDTLTYSASLADGSVLPAWLSFNPTTRTFSGTPDDAQVGSLDVRVTATDTGALSASDVFRLTVQNVNEAPTVATPLVDQTTLEDAPFSFTVPTSTFTDVDQSHGDTLTYSATQVGGATLPAWLTFDQLTRTFSGTPGNVDVGALALTVMVTDSGNLNASTTFTLSVQNVNDTPTVAAPLADQTVLEDAPFSFTVPANTFADVDTGDTLTYSATLANGNALPSWLTFNSATRTFNGTPTNSEVGTLNLTVRATDSGNLNTSDTFTLAVQNVNDAPSLANPIADHTTNTGAAFTFTVAANTFADVDAGDSLSYSATRADGTALPSWLTFTPTTRTFSGTPADSNAGLSTIQVTATDSGSLSVADLFDLTLTVPDRMLTGTSGNDVLTGGAGHDQLFGLAGNDTLDGGVGNDLLDGGTGSDTMMGGTGNDTYVVDATGDVVTDLANEGADTVQSSITYTLGGNLEHLTLTGTAAIHGTGNALNNILIGNSANNTLNGGAGNDRLDGGLGSDTMVGGTGDDTYVVNQVGDVVSETAGQGTDRVESSITFTLGSNVENLILTGTANINGTGSSANNVLMGNSGDNSLSGGSGDDQADGGAGNDALIGGSGNDIMSGGDGIDTLDGGSGDDQLFGGAGSDTLTGGSGADQFTGGTGNDTMTGGSGNDRYTFVRGNGQDTIIDTDPFPSNQDRAVFGATINPLDLVLSRQANDLRLAIHGSADQVTIQNWYGGATNQIETIQAGNGQALLNTQVDQLIQAMAGFTQQTGLSWDAAAGGAGTAAQQAQFQGVLAANWQ